MPNPAQPQREALMTAYEHALTAYPVPALKNAGAREAFAKMLDDHYTAAFKAGYAFGHKDGKERSNA